MPEISKVTLTIRYDCRLEYIDIEFSNGIHDHLFHGLIGHCCRNYSNNELKQIWKKCLTQIMSIDPDDVPPVFCGMLKELFCEMKERNLDVGKEVLENGLPIRIKVK